MGPHSTWFELFPGYETLKDNLQIYLGRRWTWQVFTATHFEIDHILGGLLVFLLLAFFAVRYAERAQGGGRRRRAAAALLPAQPARDSSATWSSA
jgi:hypothetical protein